MEVSWERAVHPEAKTYKDKDLEVEQTLHV